MLQTAYNADTLARLSVLNLRDRHELRVAAAPLKIVTVQVIEAVLSSDGMGSALRLDRRAVRR
jgi:hypothetical protein